MTDTDWKPGERLAKGLLELHTPLDGEDCCPSCGDVGKGPCPTLRGLATLADLHQRGPIRPDALVIDGDVVSLRDYGCQTCLTSWPCPTISTIGVNGVPGTSYTPDGADDAPNKPKVPLHLAPAPVVALFSTEDPS